MPQNGRKSGKELAGSSEGELLAVGDNRLVFC